LNRTLACLRAGLCLAGAMLAAAAQGAPEVPSNFVVENAVPGRNFFQPAAIAFLPDGRMLVAEKRGVVHVVENGVVHTPPLWSAENEVKVAVDGGLLGIAVHPDFATNRYVYFLYTVDPDSNGVDTDPSGYGRLTRYQVSAGNPNALDPASRQILFGTTWSTGPVTTNSRHTSGALRWGLDGSLLVTIGDGASASVLDAGGLNPDAFGPGRANPIEDIGAFRSQYLSSMCGKVLRIDPLTGRGYSTNPYYQSSQPGSVRSRVWASGMRNPFRLAVRPGTGNSDPSAGDPGSLFISEVGWVTWEEIDVARTGGANFGWPCYEGPNPVPEAQAANPAHSDCPENPNYQQGTVIWNHGNPALVTPPIHPMSGNCAMVGAFYTGTRYPPPFQNALFFADFASEWLKVATFDGNDQATSIVDFGTGLQAPVDFATHPTDGDLHYVSLGTGEVRRLRYVGTQAPGAAAGADVRVGEAPLTVSFTSAGSFSPLGRPLTYLWNFGDGQGALGPSPSHAFAQPGPYTVVLTVADDLGGAGKDTLHVIVHDGAPFPTAGVLDDFQRPNGPIGGSWVGNLQGLTISGGGLTPGAGMSTAVWNGPGFGPNQEVYFTLQAVTASPHHTLMLKIQNGDMSAGHIQVRYDRTVPCVTVATLAPVTGWSTHTFVDAFTLAPGDRLGARAYANGIVEVYRNQQIVTTCSVGDWPFAALGGNVGFVVQDATQTRIDDFGGGDAALGHNQPPTATILTPLAGTFYAHGDTIRLTGAASDPEDAAGALAWRWQVDQHHNIHVHPAVFTSEEISTDFIAEEHDDGTGTHLEVLLQITDTQGARDTARVSIHPRVDLEAAGLQTIPSTPGSTEPAEYRFWIHNRGPMLAPVSRWVLRLQNMTIAQGDTVVPALDSVLVIRQLGPAAGPGSYTLRVRVDSLSAVLETDETNNSVTRPLTVVPGSGPDELAPMFAQGPEVVPYGVTAEFRWATNEIAHGWVHYGLTPALGGSAAATEDLVSHRLTIASFQPAAKYHYRVRVADTLGNFRDSPMDSFFTEPAPIAVDPSASIEFAVSRAQPNPSRGGVRFAIDLPRPARVAFAVYDLHGREIWRAPATDAAAGRQTLFWDGDRTGGEAVRPGLYLARIELAGRVHVRRMVVIH